MIRPLLTIGILSLALHQATGQWPAERHPLYDAAAPRKDTTAAAASVLELEEAPETRLTQGDNTPSCRAATVLTAWRGERCSTQLVVRANGAVQQLRVTCSGVSNGADTIPVSVSMIRYTMAAGVATADIIGNEQCCDNPANTLRGIWVQVDVPQQAAPGRYTGQVCVSAPGCAAVCRDIALEVSPHQLPEPEKWSMHLDLWQHPQAVARWHDVAPWSPEHFALLRPLMRRLAQAGQKCITCTLLDEAWNAQTYDWFPGMVRWIRGKDGVMRYDYTALDTWVSFMHDEIGIRGQISCYTMIPWHLGVKFYDEATQSYNTVRATPGTPEYAALWAPFLRDFHQHMQARGWAEKTCIAIDERPDAYVRAAMALVKANAPSFRIASAVDKPSELSREVYNISPVLTHAGSTLGDLLQERRQAGRITTFYVCLHPGKPNTFTSSPPAEAEWLGFFAAANHLDGFLRWAYNSWNRNPFETTDFVHWPSGDCFLVYPGNRSSIRFERLRDGIENYEKINQLRTRGGESAAAAQIIQDMDAQLAALFSVERSKGTGHTSDVQQARRLIETTADALDAQLQATVP